MAGLYGTVRSAYIDPNKDAELFYFYRPNRSTTDEDFPNFKSLDASNLVPSKYDGGDNAVENVLPGMFNLRLPLDVFNDTGIYTVYIRPKEHMTHLQDVSVLADYPEIRGVVISTSGVGGVTDLTGYRIEYFDANTGKRTDRAFIICRRRSFRIPGSSVSPSAPQFQDALSSEPSRLSSPLSRLCFSL